MIKLKKILIIALMLVCLPITCFATDLKIIMTDPTPEVDKTTFSDNDISIMFYLNGRNGISFNLKNLTNKLIKIDWNQVSIIDLDQTAHRALHTGIVFAQRNDPQAPTVIPPIPMTKLNDTLFMLDHISFDNVFLVGDQWVIHDFLTAKDVNKTIGVFLPLEIGGTVKYYSFSFRIVKDLN